MIDASFPISHFPIPISPRRSVPFFPNQAGSLHRRRRNHLESRHRPRQSSHSQPDRPVFRHTHHLPSPEPQHSSHKMKILVKSLAGGNFHVEAEPTDTIGTIKNKIKDEQGHPTELQKIIFSGKVLTDDKTVADCNIKEKDFLVVMVAKVSAPTVILLPRSSLLTLFTMIPSKAKPAKPAAAAASSSATSAKEEPAAPASTESSKPAETAAAAKAEEKPETETATPAAPESAAPAAEGSSGPTGTSGSFRKSHKALLSL